MGIEYRIQCNAESVACFDEFVRGHQSFSSYDIELGLYYFRESASEAPLGWAAIESDGIYFCDNLTSRSTAAIILRDLLDHALLYSEQIIVSEP